MFWYSLLNAIVLAAMLTCSHGLMKWVAHNNAQVDYLTTLLNNWFYIGLAMSVYVFLFLYYLQVLKHVNIGVFYASYTGLSLVFVVLMGFFLFKETLSSLQMLGVFCIVLGIFFIKAGG